MAGTLTEVHRKQLFFVPPIHTIPLKIVLFKIIIEELYVRNWKWKRMAIEITLKKEEAQVTRRSA